MIKSSVNPSYVNTSESYSMAMFVGRNNIVVPYTNIDLLEGNGIVDKRKFVSFCYLILKCVKSVIIQAPQTALNLEFNDDSTGFGNAEYIQIGGYKSKGSEATVVCKEFFIFIPTYTRYSSKALAFVPLDTPATKCNMVSDDIGLFFSMKGMEAEIKNEFLGEEAVMILLRE